MFSRIWTAKSTESFSDNIKRLQIALDSADAVVIGAGAGLSAAAGFDYGGERFRKYFSDLRKNTVFTICIPAAFIRIKAERNTGRGGHGIS